MNARDFLDTALRALRANPLRSFLTTLGIIFGVASLIVMMAIGNGATARIDAMISAFGSNTLMVSGGSARSGGVRLGAGTSTRLTAGDADAIGKEISGVKVSAPQLNSNAQLVAFGQNWSSQVQGVVREQFDIANWELADGRLIEPEDQRGAAKIAVLGATVASRIFGENSPIGQNLRINRATFTVVGVLKAKGQSMIGRDQDDVVFVPLNSARRFLAGPQMAADAISNITVQMENAEQLADAEIAIIDLLRQRHRLPASAEDPFQVRNFAQIIATRSDTLRVMTSLLAVVAAIALLVGGIGIMNIMLVTVSERTKEIGLRMAIGASPKVIRRQFLIEAALLSFFGALLGVLVGGLITWLVEKFGSMPTIFDTGSVVLASVSAIVTGLFFGFYPAKQAAKLNPIDALRSE